MNTELEFPVCPALDCTGKDLKLGDWVRVITVPISIASMPDFTKRAFSNAVGHTFQIEGFGRDGNLELELWPKLSADTIWIEPYCVSRFRRYKKFSQRFKAILKFNEQFDQEDESGAN